MNSSNKKKTEAKLCYVFMAKNFYTYPWKNISFKYNVWIFMGFWLIQHLFLEKNFQRKITFTYVCGCVSM